MYPEKNSQVTALTERPVCSIGGKEGKLAHLEREGNCLWKKILPLGMLRRVLSLAQDTTYVVKIPVVNLSLSHFVYVNPG